MVALCDAGAVFLRRTAISKVLAVVVILAIVVVAGGAAFLLGHSQSGSTQRVLSIVETNPVLQIDSFNPANITVTHDSTVNLAIQNGDDETRVLEIPQFNVNETIISGETVRISFTVGAPGVFKIYSPQTQPSAASNGKPGEAITGYLIVQ